jgi:hypothetical protein
MASVDGTLVQDENQLAASSQLSLQTQQVPPIPAGYDLIRCLGSGSFGSVWLGRELNTGRLVAIKFFTRRRGLDWALLTREVEKLAVLDASRDVVRLLDVGWDHDPPYFVMEYLEEGSVANRIVNGPLPVKEAVGIAKSVARALIHAHGAGILHCDIKPANVLLDRGQQARLADFGQSRLATEHSPSLGTLFYMAPEQAILEGVPDVRWDVYALGVLLYQMITGQVPYRTPEADRKLAESQGLTERLETYRQLITQSPVPTSHRSRLGVDDALASIVDGCLQRDPQRRLPNAQVVLDLLEKRDVVRARRPLVWLGFLGPLLFLLTMLWGAWFAIPRAVDEAEHHLFDRALASDAAAVKILAGSIQQDIASRMRELEELAATISPSLEAGEDVSATLDSWVFAQQHELQSQGRTPDESLFLTDAKGVQIFRNPSNETLGKCFAYRDYFHGLGKELDPQSDLSSIQPRKDKGISLAFRSRATGQFMVALVVPVRRLDHSEPLGVIGRTIHLTDLLLQWEERIRQSSGKQDRDEDLFLSLVDTRSNPPVLLDHQWMTPENMRPLTDDTQLRSMLELDPDQFSRFREQEVNPRYADPLDEVAEEFQGEWLAACANVGSDTKTNEYRTGWVAIVQERRAKAVEPMQELYWLFFRYGLWMAIVFATMLFLLWWIVRRMLKES